MKPLDDPETPVNTVRAWVIGLLTCTIVTACNILLGLRRTPSSISSIVVQLIAYPIGRGWDAIMPNYVLECRCCLFDLKLELNPDAPFSMKEHTLIVIMTAAGAMPS